MLSRDLEQDWKEGSAVPSSVPVASPDVLLGPSLGAELEPGKDTRTYPLCWAPPSVSSQSRPSGLMISQNPCPGSAHQSPECGQCSQTPALRGTPEHPPPSRCLRGWQRWLQGHTASGRQGSPPPASSRHSQACGAHRRSGGAPSDHSPGSGSAAGCAGSAPPGTGNEALCLLRSAAVGGQTLEPGAALVEAHRTLQGGHSQELGA